FSSVVTSFSLDGDDGAFYFPYILDPQSSSAMLIGTCRVWRGSRSGAYSALSPNFDSLGSGTCSGSEVNQVRALAAGGPTDSKAPVLYVGTDIGVFASSTTSANWIEVGPSTGAPGFLPNVAVTALGLFNSGGEKLLRASTYGRGVWQFTLIARPDYRLAITN